MRPLKMRKIPRTMIEWLGLESLPFLSGVKIEEEVRLFGMRSEPLLTVCLSIQVAHRTGASHILRESTSHATLAICSPQVNLQSTPQ